MSITEIIIYVALAIMPPPITYGLPPCNGSTTGLTERHDPTTQTLYIDECLNGIPLEKNLPIIDLTTSIVIVMTRNGEVTVQLPQQQSQTPYPTDGSTTVPPPGEDRRGQPATIQSSDADNQTQNDSEQEVDCDKVKLFLDDCLMGPR